MLLKHHQRILRTWLVRLGVGKRPQSVVLVVQEVSDVPVGRDCRGEAFRGIICLQADELEGVNAGLETTHPGQWFEYFFLWSYFHIKDKQMTHDLILSFAAQSQHFFLTDL